MAARNRLLKLLTICLMPLSISGCGPDLGTFGSDDSDLDAYYESFGKVKGLYDGGSNSYDIEESLYSGKTINKFESDKDVEQEQYLYVILPFKDRLRIDAIVLFAKADITVDVEINCFYYAEEPDSSQKIKYLTSPDTEIVENPDTHEEEVKEIKYWDPPKEESMCTVKTTFKKDEWVDFVLGGFKQLGYSDNYLHARDGGLLYLRLENNSGFNRETMRSVSWSFINLMVRASEKGE